MTAVIAGTERPELPQPLLVRVLVVMLARLVLTPWVLMAGGLLYIGIGSLFRKDWEELRICLPAGIALSLLLVGVPVWLWLRSPHWIHEFRYAEGVLESVTQPGGPPVMKGAAEIASVCKVRQGRTECYLIGFRDGERVALSRRVPNADELYAALRRDLAAGE
jgi:hypothetical protein